MHMGSCHASFSSQLGCAMTILSGDIARLRLRTLMWAERLSLRPRAVRVQAMRRKWGSCSTSGTITLATDLAACDRGVQDIVIVHELLHLRIRNHGRRFRALMTVHVPHWRDADESRHVADVAPEEIEQLAVVLDSPEAIAEPVAEAPAEAEAAVETETAEPEVEPEA